MSKIVIIGGTGQIGSRIIREMLAMQVSPSDIIAIVRNEAKAAWMKEAGIEIRYGDYSDPLFSVDLLAGAEKLLFICSPKGDVTIRLKRHLNVIAAAKECGHIRHLIYVGMTAPELQPPSTGYIYIHPPTELAIKGTGIPYTFVRMPLYMEYLVDETDVARAIRTGKLIACSQHSNVNPVHRDSLALAAAKAAVTEGHENKEYSLTYPRTFRFDEIAELISRYSGTHVKHVNVTYEKMKEIFRSYGESDEEIAAGTGKRHGYYMYGMGNVITKDIVDLIGDRLYTIEDYIKDLCIKYRE